MVARWIADWKQTERGGRIVLAFLATLTVAGSLAGAAFNLSHHDYADAAAFPVPIILIGLRFVIFPFRVAWAARRRGGTFRRWLLGCILGGFIFAGTAYLIWQSGREILPEQSREVAVR
jgi:membrane protease YdiL (CAAX protease family)